MLCQHDYIHGTEDYHSKNLGYVCSEYRRYLQAVSCSCIVQGRRKLVRTGAAIHFDIGGRVTRTIKVHPCKEQENFPVYFMLATVVYMYTKNSAEMRRFLLIIQNFRTF